MGIHICYEALATFSHIASKELPSGKTFEGKVAQFPIFMQGKYSENLAHPLHSDCRIKLVNLIFELLIFVVCS